MPKIEVTTHKEFTEPDSKRDIEIENMLLAYIELEPGQTFLQIATHYKHTHSFERIVASLSHCEIHLRVSMHQRGYYPRNQVTI